MIYKIRKKGSAKKADKTVNHGSSDKPNIVFVETDLHKKQKPSTDSKLNADKKKTRVYHFREEDKSAHKNAQKIVSNPAPIKKSTPINHKPQNANNKSDIVKRQKSVAHKNAVPTKAHTSNNSKPKKKRLIGGVLASVGVILLTVIIAVVMVVFLVCTAVFSDTSITFRNLAIKTFNETSAMQWFPRIFVDSATVDEVIGKKPSVGTGEPDATKTPGNLPFTYEFDDAKGTTTDITLDLVYSLNVVCDKNLKVKSCKISDELQGFDCDNFEGESFESVCTEFLRKMSSQNLIKPNVNDSLLIGTVSKSSDISTSIEKKINDIIKENELNISVISLFSSEKDTGLDVTANELGMSYNKVKLCNLISSGNTAEFYTLSFMNLTEVINYCEKNSKDLASLVDSANIKEKDKIPETTEPYDEWSEYPDGIKIININTQFYNATVMIIKDPSKVVAGTSLDVTGRTAFSPSYSGVNALDLAKKTNALAVINGGFFFDGNYSYNGQKLYNGSVPFGYVFSHGKCINSEQYGPYKGFVGLTEDNVLVAFDPTGATAADYDKLNIRDGMSCFPILIKNGEIQSYTIFDEDDAGANPRSAIGQTANGEIIFLTIDGRGAGGSLGGKYSDIINIMFEYGAVTAVNLDGGTSSVMYYYDSQGKYGPANSYAIVNVPYARQRSLPTFFMVTK